MRHWQLHFILFCCTILLTACGFQLRNNADIPPQARIMYIQSGNPYGEFEGTLRSELPPLGIKLVDSPKSAPIILEILSSNLNYYATSISSNSQATTYNVTYTVQIAITNTKGKILVPPQSISSSANLNVNANQVLGANNQLDLLSKQLQRDIVIKLLNVLSSPQLKQAL